MKKQRAVTIKKIVSVNLPMAGTEVKKTAMLMLIAMFLFQVAFAGAQQLSPERTWYARGNVVAIAVDDNYAYAGNLNGLIQALNKKSFDFVKDMAGHTGMVTSIASDDVQVYSTSIDATVRVWRKPYFGQIRALVGGQQLFSDENYIYFGSAGKEDVEVWEKNSSTLVKKFEGAGKLLAVDSENVYSYRNGTIKVLEKTNGSLINTLDAPDLTSFASAQDYVVSGSASGEIKIWYKLDNFTQAASMSPYGKKTSAMAADGDFIYLGYEDGKIFVIKNKNAVMNFTAHSLKINSMKSDEDHVYSGSDDITLKSWSKASIAAANYTGLAAEKTEEAAELPEAKPPEIKPAEEKKCPASCDDGNSCTRDFCANYTDYACRHENLAEGAQCGSGMACNRGECVKLPEPPTVQPSEPPKPEQINENKTPEKAQEVETPGKAAVEQASLLTVVVILAIIAYFVKFVK